MSNVLVQVSKANSVKHKDDNPFRRESYETIQFANRICERFVAYQKRPKFREERVKRKKFLASKCINTAPKKFELI